MTTTTLSLAFLLSSDDGFKGSLSTTAAFDENEEGGGR
jgi:hypothetical protein